MGTTWAYRRDLRIRYVAAVDSASPAGVRAIEQYRDL
jgi:hypothetical protein